jgi:hypothetical protein
MVLFLAYSAIVTRHVTEISHSKSPILVSRNKPSKGQHKSMATSQSPLQERQVQTYKMACASPEVRNRINSRIQPTRSVIIIIFFIYLVREAIDTAATPGLLCQPRVIVKMIVEK